MNTTDRIVFVDMLGGVCALYIVAFWHLMNYTSAFRGYYISCWSAYPSLCGPPGSFKEAMIWYACYRPLATSKGPLPELPNPYLSSERTGTRTMMGSFFKSEPVGDTMRPEHNRYLPSDRMGLFGRSSRDNGSWSASNSLGGQEFLGGAGRGSLPTSDDMRCIHPR